MRALLKYRVLGYASRWSNRAENLNQDQISQLVRSKILKRKSGGEISEAACGDVPISRLSNEAIFQ